jgi:hypothetical protein
MVEVQQAGMEAPRAKNSMSYTGKKVAPQNTEETTCPQKTKLFPQISTPQK